MGRYSGLEVSLIVACECSSGLVRETRCPGMSAMDWLQLQVCCVRGCRASAGCTRQWIRDCVIVEYSCGNKRC